MSVIGNPLLAGGGGGGSAVGVTDTPDVHGGTIREITAVSLEHDTVAPGAMRAGITAHDSEGNPITGTIPDMTLPYETSAAPSGTKRGTIWPSAIAEQYLIIPAGYNDTERYYTVENYLLEALTFIENGTYDPLDYDANGFGQVTVNVPTGPAKTSSDVTVSGATVTVPAGLYASQVQKSVASGSAGTPTATKGAVSNHAVTVTPSVTNSAGYIAGGTKNGTPVTVQASELVSGSQTITQNGTVDVTDLAEVVVNVSGGGGGKAIQANTNMYTRNANSYGATSLTLTVAKSGTYNISWMAVRGSSSGTMGTRLRIGSTDQTANETWTRTYMQHNKLENKALTAGTVLTVYANSGNSSRYIGVGQLVIEEV